MAIELCGSVATAKSSGTTTGTANHTLVAGRNRVLLTTVVNVNAPGRSGLTLGTYGGVSSTNIIYHYRNVSNYDVIVWVYYIKEADLPADGAYTQTGSWTVTGGNTIFLACFSGVDQDNFPAASTSSDGLSTSLTVSLNASIFMAGGFTANPPTGWNATAPQTNLATEFQTRNGSGIAVAHKYAAGSQTCAWAKTGYASQTAVTGLVEMEPAPDIGGVPIWYYDLNPKKRIDDLKRRVMGKTGPDLIPGIGMGFPLKSGI